eukprot:SAG31_NODE_3188_length_4574_cov_2.395978_4_plen_50_part_00
MQNTGSEGVRSPVVDPEMPSEALPELFPFALAYSRFLISRRPVPLANWH